MSAHDLVLPRLCGTRWSARNLIQEQLIAHSSLHEDDGPRAYCVVTIHGDDLLACAGGYVDELIRELCQEREYVLRLSGFDAVKNADFLKFFERQIEARGMESMVVR
ncbi:hypothetical protein ACFULT_26470 [Rhodococcus sp. NPDC057297]|uniref:hypothetical protein n=1 Tax=Rhodococcus sp. NPDC057297 TaxID=3346090 RepID=UPI00362BB599